MQSSYIVHTNPDIYPDPLAFSPQRWIDNPHLTKYLVAFSRGTRGCIGINLARSELYLETAKLFRRFDLEIYETTEEKDVFTKHDFLLGHTSLDSTGIRMKVVRKLKE